MRRLRTSPWGATPQEAEPTAEDVTRADGANRRQHGRLRTDLAGEIVTALGPVMDLSRSGMRIATVAKPPVHAGLKCSLEVRCAEFQALLPVEVMRVQPGRRSRWDVGLRFRELNDEQARALGLLARMAVNTADPTRPSK